MEAFYPIRFGRIDSILWLLALAGLFRFLLGIVGHELQLVLTRRRLSPELSLEITAQHSPDPLQGIGKRGDMLAVVVPVQANGILAHGRNGLPQ